MQAAADAVQFGRIRKPVDGLVEGVHGLRRTALGQVLQGDPGMLVRRQSGMRIPGTMRTGTEAVRTDFGRRLDDGFEPVLRVGSRGGGTIITTGKTRGDEYRQEPCR